MARSISPFKRVAEEHGGKEQLVDKIVEVLERGDEDKDALKKRLQTSSNTKLVKLLAAATELKDKFGSKEKLVDAILVHMNRTKDGDYRKKLQSYTAARLLDMHSAKAAKGKKA
jgi:hypothetical protein